MEQADAGGHGQGLVLVVGDEHKGRSGLALHAQQLLAGLLAQAAVERGHRLVEQQQARPGGEGAGERDALPLAAGEGVRLAGGEVAEVDEVQQLGDAALGRARSVPCRRRPKATLSATVMCGNRA